MQFPDFAWLENYYKNRGEADDIELSSNYTMMGLFVEKMRCIVWYFMSVDANE